MDAELVVQQFCAAVSRRDLAELMAFFREDAVYHNMPMAPVQGREAIAATLEQFVGPATFAEFEVLALVSKGNLVLTERVDRFEIFGNRIELPVMGAFDIADDGRIRAWRDYFDMQQFMRQLQPSQT